MPVPRAPRPRRRAAWSVLGLPAQRARHHEADARALVIDRAGLVVDQPKFLAAGDELHLVDVGLVPALPGDEPDVAGVAQPRPVASEQLLRVLDRLDQGDRSIDLARFDEAAPELLAQLAAQGRADVAADLQPLVGLDRELLDGRAVAVVAFGSCCHSDAHSRRGCLRLRLDWNNRLVAI